MDIFTWKIKKILSEQELDRTVKVVLDVDTYAGTERVCGGFFKKDWKIIKSDMQFLETKLMSFETVAHFEGLGEDDWYKYWHKAILNHITDEEFVEEFNRRLNSVCHKIEIVGSARIKKG